jgi:hypothetical protein
MPAMPSPIHPPEVQALRALNKRFIHNFVTNDRPSHEAILHPAFRSIATTGQQIDRATYLANWAAGFSPDTIPYWDMRDERITVAGATATVTAVNSWIWRQPTSDVHGMTCYTDTYVLTPQGWLCLLAQLTPMQAQHYPKDDTIVVKYHRGALEQGPRWE